MLSIIVKVSKCRLAPFEYAQSMSKQPVGSVYVGYIFNYLIYLAAQLPRGLELDLEESSILPTLILSMHIHRLSLFNHLYTCLISCITAWQGSWAAATALCMEIG